MVQHRRHDGPKLFLRQGGDQVQHGGRPAAGFKPEQEAQQRDAGEGVELREAEALRTAADGQLNIFGDDSHVVFPTLMMFYEPSEY